MTKKTDYVVWAQCRTDNYVSRPLSCRVDLTFSLSFDAVASVLNSVSCLDLQQCPETCSPDKSMVSLTLFSI